MRDTVRSQTQKVSKVPPFWRYMVCDVQHFGRVSRLWCMRHTSSIHRRESRVVLPPMSIPWPSCLSSLDISSIRAAYSMTDRTPPCLMLSLILIFRGSPYWVCIFAVRLEFSFLIILRFSLQFYFCGGCIWLHPAMLCHMPSVHPGRWCMLFSLSLWFLWLLVLVLWGGRLLICLPSLLPGPLLYGICF